MDKNSFKIVDFNLIYDQRHYRGSVLQGPTGLVVHLDETSLFTAADLRAIADLVDGMAKRKDKP